ncbi:hypothetical protein Dimus_032356, partial [Dionaea muscipula]
LLIPLHGFERPATSFQRATSMQRVGGQLPCSKKCGQPLHATSISCDYFMRATWMMRGQLEQEFLARTMHLPASSLCASSSITQRATAQHVEGSIAQREAVQHVAGSITQQHSSMCGKQ